MIRFNNTFFILTLAILSSSSLYCMKGTLADESKPGSLERITQQRVSLRLLKRLDAFESAVRAADSASPLLNQGSMPIQELAHHWTKIDEMSPTSSSTIVGAIADQELILSPFVSLTTKVTRFENEIETIKSCSMKDSSSEKSKIRFLELVEGKKRLMSLKDCCFLSTFSEKIRPIPMPSKPTKGDEILEKLVSSPAFLKGDCVEMKTSDLALLLNSIRAENKASFTVKFS